MSGAWVSNERVGGRYAVLEFVRGPRLGTIRNAGTRRWIAECPDCGDVGDGRTRPIAARVLLLHKHTVSA